MIIHTPELIEQNEEICVQARVELIEGGVTTSKELWFKFPESHRKYVTDRADGFAVSMLLVAMEQGEDMEVRGVLSPRLMYGMQEYQRFYRRMVPERFKLVDIKCENLKPVEPDKVQGGVGCAFSGGVDSFFTLWSHLKENEKNPSYQISHIVFARGLMLEDEPIYEKALKAYQDMVQELGLELLPAKTNARHCRAGLWNSFFLGAVLIGTAHVLGPLFSRFYIAASDPYGYRGLRLAGLDNRIDHLLSTETLEIFHDGAGFSRCEKHVQLAQWSPVYSRLRVCHHNKRPTDVLNCCRCEKCLRTMVSLDILGVLSRYTCFHLPLRWRNILLCKMRQRAMVFWIEIRQQAIKTKRCGLAIAISFCLARSRVRILRKGIERWAWRIYLQLKSLVRVQIGDKERN